MTRFTQSVAIIAFVLGAHYLTPSLLSQARQVNTLLVAVTPDGIFPPKVTLPPGPLTITIFNRTGHANTEFRISPVGDARTLASAKIDTNERKLQRVNASVTLTPGEYALTIPNRPGIECRITIKP